MTTIVVTASKAPLTPGAPPTGIVGTTVSVVDNSGATLGPVTLNGSETPPWQASFTGAAGSAEATATLTDVDAQGNTIGSPVLLTESGSGGVIANLPATSGGTISVS